MRKFGIRYAAPAAFVLLLVGAGFSLGPLVRTVQADASDHTSSTQPVVVELFTSQGCSSCPPADALLTELAREPGVIALSFHVDYWDYIGWADPYAAPEMTARQKDYAHKLAGRYVYTPQIVIDGQRDVVGSHRREVRQMIAQAAARPKLVTPRYEEDEQERYFIVIPAGDAPAGGAPVWLAAYDASHETEVLRGENRGKSLRHSNVVRELEQIATWDGSELVIPVDTDALAARGRNACAVIVQAGQGGAVLGAVAFELDEEH